MANLFDQPTKKTPSGRLLADILRPKTLAEVVGQNHLIHNGGPLELMVREKKLRSMILWGPPGVGKTSLARLLAALSGMNYRSLSAVFSGVADLKKIFEEAEAAETMGLGTCLFVDEIHRFNRAQQDSFLPLVERGTVVLIGATTENPSFALNNALLSRLSVFVLNPLGTEHFAQLLQRAQQHYGQPINVATDSIPILYQLASGDGRYFLNLVEQVYHRGAGEPLAGNQLLDFLQKKSPLYDKTEEGHYNYISALHKSVRGSDADASLYWLYRMLQGGEDRDFLARRIVRMAYEDIGLADTNAQTVAINAWETMERLGSPEGELALAQAVVYLAYAPKSNSIYRAAQAAESFAKTHNHLDPPKIILNAPTPLMKKLDYGRDYIYDHNDPDGFSGQHYFPDGMARVEFFDPIARGFERELQKRKDYFSTLRAKKQKP